MESRAAESTPAFSTVALDFIAREVFVPLLHAITCNGVKRRFF